MRRLKQYLSLALALTLAVSALTLPGWAAGDCARTGHRYTGEVLREATASKAGLITYQCTQCGDRYTAAIPAGNGSTVTGIDKIDSADLSRQQACAHSGPKAESGLAVSCTEFYNIWECLTCGKLVLKSRYDGWDGHQYGYSGDACTKCGHIKGTPEGSQCQHQWGPSQELPAACTTAGRRWQTCSLCGTQKTLGSLPPAGHSFTRSGDVYTCSVCGYSYSTAQDPQDPQNPGPGDPCQSGHSYTSKVTKEPTASAPGVRTFTCSVCGASYTQAIPRLDGACAVHHWGSYQTVQATCTQAGYSTRTCSVCGAEERYNETKALGHSYSERITKPASATEDGEKVFTCRRCQDSYTEVIPKAGGAGVDPNTGKPCVYHRWDNYQKVPATCEADGRYSHTCTVCGLEEVYHTVPKLGHKYEGVITRPAQIGQAGEKTFTCSTCGKSYTEPVPALSGTTESPVTRDPAAKAAATTNKGRNQYYAYRYHPVESYLYRRSDGGVTRVEAWDGKIIVEAYDKEFRLLTSASVPGELELFGGFFPGEGYHYLIFGQKNPGDSKTQEVLRVVQYSKDWKRLKAVSIQGANTYIPFDAGSLRCAEYNGMLYIHTCHEMFAGSDGVHHQANMMFSIRQSDLAVTDGNYQVSNSSTGYISHSFNQFILVDRDGRLVTANHGDAYPRALTVSLFDKPAGEEKFSSYMVATTAAQSFIPAKRQYNYTGAWLGGFEESPAGYLLAYASCPQTSGDVFDYKTKNIFVNLTGRDIKRGQNGASRSIQLTNYAEGGARSAGMPFLVKVSDQRYVLLWNIQQLDQYGYYRDTDTLGYAFVDGSGQLIGQPGTAQGALSDCQPILLDGRVVWYVTSESAPVFYSMDPASGAITASGALDGKPDDGTGKPDDGKETELPQPGQQQTDFTDVPSTHWAIASIRRAVQDRITNGYPDGSFRPKETMSNAHFAAFLARSLYSDLYDDSNASPWYKPYMDTLFTRSVCGGTAAGNAYHSSGSYTGVANSPISRYDMAQLMYNILLDKGVDLPDAAQREASESAITDWAGVPAQYREAVRCCYALGLLKGRGNGSFDGQSIMNRAEGCEVICRLKDFIAG